MRQYWRLEFLSALTLVIIFGAFGCENLTDRQHRRILDALVQRHATRAEVARELGAEHRLYVKGEPSWSGLEEFLKGEPPDSLRCVREAVTKYPVIMYYTTMWRMTWIFLDDKERVQGYCLSAQ